MGEERTNKKLKILFFGQFTINHDYGGQGLAYPIMEYLDKFFDIEYSFMVSEKYYQENLPYAEKKGFKLVPFPYPKIFIKNQDLINAIKETDIIIDVDGIEYIGNLPKIKKWFHFYRTSYIQDLAKKYKKIYLKSPKSYGPIQGKIFKMLVKRKLNKVPFILVRGKENFENLKNLNLKTPIYNCPDVSLILKQKQQEWAIEYLEKLGINPRKELIGISPSYVMNNKNEDHLELSKKIIKYFQSKGLQILIIPHAINDSADISSCDLALCKYLYEDLEDKQNVFLITDTDLEYKEIRSIIGRLSFYITARYHGLASALYMKIPTVIWSWHTKYKDMASLYLSEPKIISEEMTPEQAIEFVKSSYENQSWFDKTKMEEKQKNVESEINKNLNLFVEKIKERTNEST